MYFAEKITSIKPGDKVLEIGPGGTPHPRADVFLELKIDSEQEALAQRAYQDDLQTSKEVVFYDGTHFPFKDDEFDYIICSHVLEHVPDIETFIAESKRVSPKGYWEFPSIYYDHILEIPEHLNLLLYRDNKLYWAKKNDLFHADLKIIQKAYYDSFHKCYGYRLIPPYKKLFFQGFEWDRGIELTQVDSIEKLAFNETELESKLPKLNPPEEYSANVIVSYKNDAQGPRKFFRKVYEKLGNILLG